MYGISTSLSALKKLLYQTLSNAKITGIFLSKSVFLKWLSILLAPFKSALKLSNPTAKLIVRPTALHNENLPPTQSHIGKTLSGLIPNSVTFCILVETATKCLATSSCFADCKNHLLMVSEFVNVSCVVNVLDTITNKVVSGFNFLIISLT